MQTIAEWSLRFLDEHAQLALFVWLLLEEAGLPMPLPGDVIVVAAGTKLAHGGLSWLTALALVSIATVGGSSILFWVARRGGRPLLTQFGPYLQLDAERLARSEEFLQRRGFQAVVIGRLTPGLRVVTTVAAGAFGVPYRQFLPASLIGSNNLVLLLAGYFFGPELLRAIQGFGISFRLVSTIGGLVLIVASYLLIRRRAGLSSAATDITEPVRVETAAMAGVLALAASVAVINVVLLVLAAFGETDAAHALFALTRGAILRSGAAPIAVLITLGAVLFIGVQIAWAILYAHIERWLPKPDWIGGLLYALVPLAVSLLVLLPTLGAGVAGFGLAFGAIPLIGEIVRNAIYGFMLSTSYTVLSRARARRRSMQPGHSPQNGEPES